MSDPQAPVGEPVEEPKRVDDVVGQAHEGLAEAEAAGHAAVGSAAPEPDAAPAEDAEPAFSTPELNEAYAQTQEPVEPAESAAAESAAAEPTPAAAPEAIETAPHAEAAAPEAAVAAAAVAAPAAEAPVYAPVPPAGPQPIFVQAPEEPRPRGNRGAAGAIGILAAICFAILYLGAALGMGILAGSVELSDVGTWIVRALTTWELWTPTVVFFLAFWLLGAIINRGRWGAWVIFGILVGLAAYGGHILGALFAAPFWAVNAQQGNEIVQQHLFAPLAIAAFVIGRELTIWFSAWVARRGRRMTELNVEARREYERTLEAGPQLAR